MAATQDSYYLPSPSRWPITGSIGLFTLLGGFAILLVAVSWQIVPMFYMTAPYPRWVTRLSLGLIAVTVAGLTATTFTDVAPNYRFAAALPGAIAIWVLLPAFPLGRHSRSSWRPTRCRRPDRSARRTIHPRRPLSATARSNCSRPG